MLTLFAIKILFFSYGIIKILLYLFVENILLIAVMLSIFYVVMKAYLQLQQKKRLQADFHNSDNNGFL